MLGVADEVDWGEAENRGNKPEGQEGEGAWRREIEK
jgi:hypothetical protein